MIQMPKTAFMLGYLALLLGGVLGLLTLTHPDDMVKGVLLTIATGAWLKAQSIYDFFYGSSHGSKSKDAAALAATPAPEDKPNA